jgi:hypothetical protein
MYDIRTVPHEERNSKPPCARLRSAGITLQAKLPGFGNQVFAEAVMPFFPRHAKSSLLVNVPRRIEFALCPQHDSLVSCLPRESHTLTHQPRTNA